MDVSMGPSNYLLQLGKRKTHLHLPVLVVLLCVVTTTWGNDLNNLESDKGLLENSNHVNEVLDGNEEVVKLLEEDTKSSTEDVLPCWKTETFTTQGPCQACDEYALKFASYCCRETGFRQLIHCESSNYRLYKSCPKSKWAMEKGFWTFEGVMLAIGMSSFLVVIFRRRALDWEALKRVRKQIANSA